MVITDKFETVEVDLFLSVRNKKCMRNGAKGVTYTKADPGPARRARAPPF